MESRQGVEKGPAQKFAANRLQKDRKEGQNKTKFKFYEKVLGKIHEQRKHQKLEKNGCCGNLVAWCRQLCQWKFLSSRVLPILVIIIITAVMEDWDL